MKKLQQKLDEIWENYFSIVPRAWWRVPVRMYGIGLFNITDRRKVARITFLRGREEKPPAQSESPGDQFYARKLEKWFKRRKLEAYDFKKVPQYARISLQAPPKEQSMVLDDTSFNMMLATRYCSDKLDLCRSRGQVDERCCCAIHKKAWTFQHILGCSLSALQATSAQHDQVAQYICGILLRSHLVQKVKRERKSIEQERRFREGKEAKRADILFWSDGVQHSIDVSVTTSWSVQKRGNPISQAMLRKKREYKGECNIHIALFDTAGGVAEETWRFLERFGASSYDLRRLQTIIFRSTAKKYAVIACNCKNRVYGEDRESDRVSFKRGEGLQDIHVRMVDA